MAASVPLVASLVVLSGCCLSAVSGSTQEASTTSGESSVGGGPGGATTGGSTGGTTGTGATTGGTTGRLVVEDAGFCTIGGVTISGGNWLDAYFGSCTICDPAADTTTWTELDSGAPCRGFLGGLFNAPPYAEPFAGKCYQDSFLIHSFCDCTASGGRCEGGFACCGGYCDDGGQCRITQNINDDTECGEPPSTVPNACAFGPCCLDAGPTLPDGSFVPGWCCGLVDGGEHPCLSAGNVCYGSSNCCAGLDCISADVVFDGGESYGICE